MSICKLLHLCRGPVSQLAGEGARATQSLQKHRPVFHSFDDADGASPAHNPVTFDPSGNLFFATYYGGLHVGYDGHGVVHEIAP